MTGNNPQNPQGSKQGGMNPSERDRAAQKQPAQPQQGSQNPADKKKDY